MSTNSSISLVRAYFPNGLSFSGFYETCQQCRHCIDNLDNPKPGRLSAPFNTCTWGVLDLILHGQATGKSESQHAPENMAVVNGSPRCLRFTPLTYQHTDRDPPIPDVPGQLMLTEFPEVQAADATTTPRL